jgi:hypothetical protein
MATRKSTTNSSALVPPDDGQLHDAPGLGFPDWSGMATHEARMTLEQAVQRNEEMLALFPPKPNRAALDADAKCEVEFGFL